VLPLKLDASGAEASGVEYVYEPNGAEMLARLEHTFSTEAAQCRIREAQLLAHD
jgi:hypothetical protein